MNEINCSHCNKKVKLIDFTTGFPIYYLGSGPNNPQDAEAYFCGAYCSNYYVRLQKISKNT
jgi:hypothetical protein